MLTYVVLGHTPVSLETYKNICKAMKSTHGRSQAPLETSWMTIDISEKAFVRDAALLIEMTKGSIYRSRLGSDIPEVGK